MKSQTKENRLYVHMTSGEVERAVKLQKDGLTEMAMGQRANGMGHQLCDMTTDNYLFSTLFKSYLYSLIQSD